MNFLEKELEQIIWESDNMKLRQKGLEISGKKFRQLRVGNYGILDLLTVEKLYYSNFRDRRNDPYLNITVYELKKEKVGISAFLQSIKYCKGIKSYLSKRKLGLKFKLNVVLCAKEVDTTGDFIYLTDLFTHEINTPNSNINSVSAYSFNFDIDGINFRSHTEYSLIREGFNLKER